VVDEKDSESGQQDREDPLLITTLFKQQKAGAIMQTNRQSKLLTHAFREVFWLIIALASLLLLGMLVGFFRLFIALASLLLLGILVQFLLRSIVLRNKALRAKLVKPYDAVILKMAGGPFSPYAVLTHTGRRSGRTYQTPLGASPLGDGFVLGLAFGADADWCRNVLAAGKCTLKWHGQEYALEKPEIIPASEALLAFPQWKRFLFVRIGVKQYLWVHRPRAVPEKAIA
jgi:deazaflavin-dependent oxidoreductase (nitroreductase family)